MEWLDIILSLLSLVILEVVLGIDNLVLLAVLTDRLPHAQRKKARKYGLTFAWMTRLMLLASAVWISKLVHPVLTIFTATFSYRDLFLLVGGIFLMTKATQEIHQEVVTMEHIDEHQPQGYFQTFWGVILQIAIMDIIFSLDSVLTAVGLTQRFWVMATAITIAVLVMIYASEWVSRFIEKFPTIKMLALSFLILIGMVLVADGFSFHVPRGYIYFAMGFSLTVEALNLVKIKRRQQGKK